MATWRRVPVLALSVVVAVSLLAQPTATAATPAPRGEDGAPPTQVTKSVPVEDIDPGAAKLKHAPSVTARGSESPHTGTQTVSLTTSADSERSADRSPAQVLKAGNLGIAVGPASAAPEALSAAATDAAGSTPTSPKGAQVRVQTAALPDQPGLSLTLGGLASQVLTVQIDLDQFGNRFGGDWASRVQLRDVTECPETLDCGTFVPTASSKGSGDESNPVLTTVVRLHPLEGAGGSKPLAEPKSDKGTPIDDGAAAGVSPRGAGPGSGTIILAAMAGATGSSGDFTATDLSASGTWSAGGQAGDMTWSYPFRVPPSASGLDPQLALSYSSSSVDGRTTSTNNQPSWVGEGFSLATGFIERRYVACADDQGTGRNNATKTGDLCWKTDSANSSNQKWDNAVVSFGPHSGELVRVGDTSTWRLRFDDGSRFEKLTGASNGDAGGEYWKMTTPDGTQYFFGQHKPNASATELTNSTWTVPVFGNHSGEPGYNASFASSSTARAWRWNLDRVVTTDGDAMTYYYAQESNRYQRLAGTSGAASAAYVRGGYLTRIDYGQRAGSEHTPSGARVTFAVVERCDNVTYPSCQGTTLGASTAVQWPDVPFDQICSSTTSCSATTQGSPSFFSRKRLNTVTTSVRNAAGTGYDNADRWTFATAFPDPGDGTTAALALRTITQAGLGGTTINLPAVTFHTAVWENRVDGIDNAPPLNKHRVYAILSGTGEYLNWEYSAKDCTPSTVPTAHTNTKRCFPVYWTPPGATAPELHWFHKYVVTSVTSTDLSNASAHSETVSYTYSGSPAWRYDNSVLTPSKYRGVSQFS